MRIKGIAAFIAIFATLNFSQSLSAANRSKTESDSKPILWEEPKNISSRNLLSGPGETEGVPVGPFVFLEEDLDGTNPKFSVRDKHGIEWKVKIGIEARPEVAAARLLWAAGYFTGDYYFLPKLRVENLPVLKRGQDLLGPDGAFYGARLKRESAHGKKVDKWSWRKNPFLGTREFNGLRVMMALINNWDLKDANNAILRKKNPKSREIYLVSDLGASFGTNNWIRPLDHAKGNLTSFTRSNFVEKITDEYVDLDIGKRPAIINAVNLPLYFEYLKMDWIGKEIPRSDARWIGQLLSRLSAGQIADAFRAAGFAPHEIEGYTQILLSRIAELKKL